MKLLSMNGVLSTTNIDSMKLLLSHIRVPCANAMGEWYIVGTALHHWSGGDVGGLQLWIDWSNKYRCKCQRKWAIMQATECETPRTVYSLIGLHVKYSKIPWVGDFTKLSPWLEFDLLQDLPKTIETVYFNDEFISASKAIRFTDNEISCILSPTGTGKTQLIVRNVQATWHDIKLLSVVPRISLAKVHQKEWGLQSYLETSTHGVDEVICIDSLMKLESFANNPNSPKFILVLDEFNSLIMHTLNNLKSMSMNRFKIYDVFKKLIRKAKFTICLDADVSSGALKFIQELSAGLHVKLFINEFRKVRTTPVTFFASKPEIRNDMLNKMRAGEKVFVISDDKNTFLKTVVKPIWNREPELRNSILVYTAEQGSGDDLGNVNEAWAEANVFASPRIIYGVDFNIPNTHHVYHISYGKHTLNALSINQQIARIRNPLSINVYCQNRNTRRFFSREQVAKDHQLRINSFGFGGNELIAQTQNESVFLPVYRDLVIWNTYLDDALKSNLAMHLRAMLGAKGFTNIKFDPRKRKFKFPRLTPAEDKLYNASLLTLADSQYATYVKQINDFVIARGKDGIHLGFDITHRMKSDRSFYTTIQSAFCYLIPPEANGEGKVHDGPDTIITSLPYKIKLAKIMERGLRLKPLDYDREKDAKTMANAIPRIGKFSDDLLGQIVSAFPTNNKINKFKDHLKYKTPAQYYTLFIEMMANLFPSMFKPIQSEYRDVATGARVRMRTWKFDPADRDIILKAFQND